MARSSPLPFSPFADFVATRTVTIRGNAYERLDPIDKTGLDERTLRNLFDSRKIAPVGFAGPAPKYLTQPAPPAPVDDDEEREEGGDADDDENKSGAAEDDGETKSAGGENETDTAQAAPPINLTVSQMAAAVADVPRPKRVRQSRRKPAAPAEA